MLALVALVILMNKKTCFTTSLFTLMWSTLMMTCDDGVDVDYTYYLSGNRCEETTRSSLVFCLKRHFHTSFSRVYSVIRSWSSPELCCGFNIFTATLWRIWFLFITNRISYKRLTDQGNMVFLEHCICSTIEQEVKKRAMPLQWVQNQKQDAVCKM